MRRTVRLLLAIVLGAILVAGIGCDDPTEPLDCTGGGRLQGTVFTGDAPDESLVRVRSVPDENGNGLEFRIRPDELGRYGIDLPVGEYLIEFRVNGSYSQRYDYTAEGLGYGQVPPDTVTIDASVSPVVIDFRLGALAMSLDIPVPLQGAKCEFFLQLRDEDTTYNTRYVDEGTTEFEGGRAEILLPGVLPGEYRIGVTVGATHEYWDCPYDGEHFWMPGIQEEEASPWYTVVADTVTTLVADIEEEAALIEGQVIGSWLDLEFSRPPALALFTTDSIPVAGLCTVGPRGGFSLPVFHPQPVKILVSQEGVDQWIGGPGFADATVFDLQPGQTVSGIELVQSGLQIDTREDKSTLIPIWGPRIVLYDAADMRLLATTSWYGDDGALTGIPNLWPGDYLVYFTPDPDRFGNRWWLPQWYDRAPEADLAQVVTIGSPGEIVTLDVTLERGGTISGRVGDEGFSSNLRAVVVATAGGDVIWGYDSIYEERTDFSVIGLPDGDYLVGVTPPLGFFPQNEPAPEGTIWYPGTTEWSAATVFEIRDAADIADLVIPLD